MGIIGWIVLGLPRRRDREGDHARRGAGRVHRRRCCSGSRERCSEASSQRRSASATRSTSSSTSAPGSPRSSGALVILFGWNAIRERRARRSVRGPASIPGPGPDSLSLSRPPHHGSNATRDGAVGVVRATGELDAYAAPDLEARLRRARRSSTGSWSTSRRLVPGLDCARSSSSRGDARASTRGGRVRVVLPTAPARRIFEITTLDRVLPVAPSRRRRRR